MHVRFEHFDGQRFSFHHDPVLVIEDFWTVQERRHFQQAMSRAVWTPLHDMPQLRGSFPDCGNWQKADIARPEAMVFLDRLALPCITNYIESFPKLVRRHMNFNYYAYRQGDCLLTHDDTAQEMAAEASPIRRLAVVAYLHDEWQPDWGGELMMYRSISTRRNRSELTISHCIAPKPGTLVLFTVPRFHRVCRIDPLSGSTKRLSIGGWFMTEQQVSSRGPTRHLETSPT